MVPKILFPELDFLFILILSFPFDLPLGFIVIPTNEYVPNSFDNNFFEMKLLDNTLSELSTINYSTLSMFESSET